MLTFCDEVETSVWISKEAVEVLGLSLCHVRGLMAAAETPPLVGTLRR
ncbi:hypothetical protein ACFLVO_02560 [Chloroflexota bacterium]